MRTTGRLFSLVALLGLLAMPAGAQMVGTYIGPQVSSLGVGASAQVKLLQFSLSGEFGIIPVDRVNLSSDGIEYGIQTDLGGGLVLLNFHPGVLGLTLGGGVMIGGYNAYGNANDLVDLVEIGEGQYNASDIGSLEGRFDFGGPAPAFMIGRRSGGLNIGLGVALTGTPKIGLTATGPIAADSQFMADLDSEIHAAQAELNNIPVMPLVRIGWQFGLGI